MVRGIAARAHLAPSFTTVPDGEEIVLATQSDGAFSSTTSPGAEQARSLPWQRSWGFGGLRGPDGGKGPGSRDDARGL
jgi:hypothetical protein